MSQQSDPIASSVWVRSPRQGRVQPGLSREQIVQAAIDVLDTEGLSALSMRKLGRKLGSGTTSVYWYVANKDELLELAVDQVMGEIQVPDPDTAGWRVAAAAVATETRAAMLRHPWMTRLIGVRPAIGPNAMRVSDRAIGALIAGGFSGMDLAYGSSLLMSHAIGAAVTGSALHAATEQAGKDPQDLMRELTPHLDRIAEEYPNYTSWWTEHKDVDIERFQEDSFRFGLERLLDGLEQRLDGGR